MPPSLGGAGANVAIHQSFKISTAGRTVHSLTFRLLCRSYPRSTTSASFKMANVKSKTSKKVIGLVKEYESDILSTDNTVLFCKACGKTINHEKKYFVYLCK
ncbi:hypothetical protein T02_3441 [Trichinella nativa]|uniref:Uncharacterized protein n=1 Tax=Trichinella nativa TaxID=6335 RepID=A0A0V1KNN5_9BILA|nr:hypothetical protein T02_3441 [Trichinella nativa]